MIGTGSSHAQLNAPRVYGLAEGIDYRAENLHEQVMALTNGQGADAALDPVGDLLRRMASGELTAVIDRTFPLSEGAAAHAYAETRERIGTIIMTP